VDIERHGDDSALFSMTHSVPTPVCLVADMGGTNTRIGLASGAALHEGTVAHYRNSEFGSPLELIETYLSGQPDSRPDATAIATAGLIEEGRCRITNNGWELDTESLSRTVGSPVAEMLNDLEAQGYALDRLAPGAIETILPGDGGTPDAPRLVAGIGTGFNASPVHLVGSRSHVAASEAGQAAYSSARPELQELARWISERRHDFVSVEDVVSGPGLENCDAFLATRNGGDARVRRAADIAKAAHAGETRATEAARLFCTALGALLGDLALIHLPFGGIYLVGGVARAMLPFLGTEDLAGPFLAKGRFADFMERFPVRLVDDDNAALSGCAVYLRRHGAT